MRKKHIIIILVFLAMAFNRLCLAEVADIIQLDSTIHNYIGGSSGEDSIDGDFSTAQSAYAQGNNGGHGVALYSEHTFARPVTIFTVRYKMHAHAWAHGSNIRDHNASIYVEYSTDNGGTWTTLPESSAGCGGGDGYCEISKDNTWSGELKDITDIRVYAQASGNASGDDGNAGGTASIYELQTQGIYYKNIGLKVKTGIQTVNIGVEDLIDGVHKLRIRKGDTTYGIPLLPIYDKYASSVRIYDGNEIKALPKTVQ